MQDPSSANAHVGQRVTTESAPADASPQGRYTSACMAALSLAEEVRLQATAGLSAAATDWPGQQVIAFEMSGAMSAAGLRIVTAAAIMGVACAKARQ